MIGSFLQGLAEAHAEIMAERAKTGGPAFPAVALGDPNHPASEPGMTLRDWFAGQALPAVIQVCAASERLDGETMADMFARKALEAADAMLAARLKVPDA